MLSAEIIRIIHSEPNATFLDVGGKLQVFGHVAEVLMGSEFVDKASEIAHISRPEAGRPVLIMEGEEWVQTPPLKRQENGMFQTETSHHGGGYLFPALRLPTLRGTHGTLSVINESMPQTVLQLRAGVGTLFAWNCGQDEELVADSFDLPSPVKQVVITFDYFTALTEDNEVFTWKPPNPRLWEAPAKTGSSPAKPLQAAYPETNGTQEEEDGPDMSAFLDDFPTTAPSEQTVPEVSRL